MSYTASQGVLSNPLSGSQSIKINPPLVSAETGAPFRDRQSETQTSECGSWNRLQLGEVT